MLKDRIIQESKSPFVSSILLVEKQKKETLGKLRFCVDYRQLNKLTKRDQYPLPRIQDILDNFQGASYFTTLDLASGFHQVEMELKHRELTAFTTEFGNYEFLVMPFGLMNAPLTFQRLVDKVFDQREKEFTIAYIDNIIIFSRTWKEHLEHIELALKRLKTANLKIRLKKCYFGKRSADYLGFVISGEGIRPNSAKVIQVQKMSPPANLSEVRAFLGMVGYYSKFVPDLSKIASPLYQLMRKDVKFNWTVQRQEAFDQIKLMLISAPVLAHPNFDKPFILHTDASKQAIGVVLSQLDDNGMEKVICYGGRVLNQYERN